MTAFSNIVPRPILPILRKNARERAISQQGRLLKKLLILAGNTDFGKKFHFEQILFDDDRVIANFQKNVPIMDYSKIHPWWQRAYQGEENVTWPGKIKYFALSSGTSEGSSKYIPVTKQMLKAIKRGGLRQLTWVGRCKKVPKDVFTRHTLAVGGSTDLHFNGINFSGDLSGITTGNFPLWFQPFTKPQPSIRAKKSWDEKLEEMVNAAPAWDIGIVAGVPSWIQILFERIIEKYKLESIHDIWPNLAVFFHGGVALDPYKASIESLCRKPLTFWDGYLASEGFIACQIKQNAKGMRLLTANGIFYEFIPFDDQHFTPEGDLKPDVNTFTVGQIKEGVEYAILLTTCAGAWRYLIGDVIKFVDLQKMEVKIVGRTKHYISLCGEHLSVENMMNAVAMVNKDFNFISNEFTLSGIRYQGLFAHQWFIGCDTSLKAEEIKEKLDSYLCQLNDDYAVERKHALKEIIIHLIPNDSFNEFLKQKGKQGGQVKFPRVLKGKIYEDWITFLKSQNLIP